MRTPELKQFWEQTYQRGEHATVPDLLCVFINFRKLQKLFHAHTRWCTQVFGDRLSVSWCVTPPQIEVHALCNYFGAASYILSRDLQTTPPTPPHLPCIATKFAARCWGWPASCCEGVVKALTKGLDIRILFSWERTYQLKKLTTSYV